MPQLGERGMVQVVLILLLLAGLGSGLYLSQNTAIFAPKAFERLGGFTNLKGGTNTSRSDLAVCKNTVANFYVSIPCSEPENGFRRSNFSCSAGSYSRTDSSTNSADLTTCKTVEKWFSEALKVCKNSCNVTTTPIPSIDPGGVCPGAYPACLGGEEPIQISQAPGGCAVYICPTPTVACAQVVTSAKNTKTGECKEFSSPCDVPAGWEKVQSCLVVKEL